MEQIKIGTLIPGKHVLKALPEYIKYGFETYSITFHMEFGGVDIWINNAGIANLMQIFDAIEKQEFDDVGSDYSGTDDEEAAPCPSPSRISFRD